jgi:acyl carrier protein
MIPDDGTARATTMDGKRLAHRQIHERLVSILQRLMPDRDLARVPRDVSLRKALAADSMDVLNFVTALHEELGVEVPERDYDRLDTIEGCVDYLVAALGASAAARRSES